MSTPPSIPASAASQPQDARWFVEEVRPHEVALRSYLRSKYPGLSDVDDVVQEAFLKAFVARQRGALVSIRGFLFTVARNAAISFFRRRRFLSVQPVHELAEGSAIAADADVVEAVCSDDEFALITQTLAGLPARCREVLTLRLLGGLDYPAIAARLGVTEETVRVQVARGAKRCHEILSRRGIAAEKS